MNKLQKIKDELAINHNHNLGAKSNQSFRLGFDSASAEWEKIVEPLIEALELVEHHIICMEAGRHKYKCKQCLAANKAREAIENYRKARE